MNQEVTVKARGTSQDERMHLRLYVAGQTPKSLAALTNLRRICEEHLNARYQLEVLDVARNPQSAADDEIIAAPTLVRLLPRPVRKVLGDLSDAGRVLEQLGIGASFSG